MSDIQPGPHSLRGRRVLVTGAAGFIGSNLCSILEQSGANVLRTSRSTGFDVTDTAVVDGIFQQFRPESVFHLASTVTGAKDSSLVLPTFHNNLATTVNLLMASHEHGVKRVLCLGSLHEPHNNRLEAANSPYAASKFCATAYARMFASLYGLSVTVAVPFMVYGPGQRDTSKVLPHVITTLLDGQAPRLSSCTQAFDWVHVRDVVDGLVAIHNCAELDGAVVDLGSGELTTVAEVLTTAATLLGFQHLLNFGSLPDRVGEPLHPANTADTYRLTGWRPSINLAEGLGSTVAWYKEQHRDER